MRSIASSFATADTKLPSLWLSDGWATVNERQLGVGRLYWNERPRRVSSRLAGVRDIDEHAPVCHVSLLRGRRVCALGRRKDCRRRFEWEDCGRAETTGSRQSAGLGLRLAPGGKRPTVHQFFGDVWEWTSSAYAPYPGLSAARGLARRVQWQVHVQPDDGARGFLRHERADHIRRKLPELSSTPMPAGSFLGIRLAKDGHA